MNFKKPAVVLIAPMLVTLTVSAVEIPPPLSDPNNTGNWQINPEVSDEFNGDTFDRDVWFNQGENDQWNNQWKGRSPSQFNPDNIKVEGGFIHLTSRWDPNYNFSAGGSNGANSQNSLNYGDVAPVTTAALLGKNFFQYGYMEMRSKAAPGPISSSYWTTGVGGETDAFESFGYNPPNNRWSAQRFHSSFHDWRVQGSSTYGTRIWDNEHILDFDVSSGFHTYGFEWDPEYVAIYIDGALINCVTRESMGDAWVAINEQRPWIDMEIFDWEMPAAQLRAEHFNGHEGIDFVIDYARVYQRTGDNNTSGGTCESRTNLVNNPGFENGTTGWTGNATSTTVAKHAGNSSAVLTGSATISQVVTVKPNTTYMLSAFANSADTNESNIWRNVYLGARDFNDEGNNSNTDVRFFFPRFDEKSVQFTTGASNTEATIYFTNAPNGGLAYLDDVKLIEESTIAAAQPEILAVSSLEITADADTVVADKLLTIKTKISPLNASNKSIVWATDASEIATVSYGIVRGVSEGSATITATTEDGSFSESVLINVTAADDENTAVGGELVVDGSFESGNLAAWSASRGNSAVVNSNAVSGSSAGYLSSNGAIQQPITVAPNTTYTLTATAKVGAEGQNAYIGVSAFPDLSVLVESITYVEYTITFTTGGDSTSEEIYLWNGDAGQEAYIDDVSVIESGSTPEASPTPMVTPSPVVTPTPMVTPSPMVTPTPISTPAATPSPTATQASSQDESSEKNSSKSGSMHWLLMAFAASILIIRKKTS